MEEQIGIVREETKKKRTFEEVSRIIRQTITVIKDNIDREYFYFSPLWASRDQILAYIHDNKLKTLTFHIKPQSIECSFYDGQKLRMHKVKTAKDLIETIRSWLNSSVPYSGGTFNFDCDPDILLDPWIELGDAFYAIREFYRAYRTLESYDNVIDAFDNTVLKDLKQTIDNIPKVIFKSLMSDHKIEFKSIEKSEQILAKLRDEICGLYHIERLLRKLSDELCDQRLSNIQKEMFLKS